MTVEYRCPECGHVFKPDWIMDWGPVEVVGSDYIYYQYCNVDCECGRQLTFTTIYEITEVEVEVEE